MLWRTMERLRTIGTDMSTNEKRNVTGIKIVVTVRTRNGSDSRFVIVNNSANSIPANVFIPTKGSLNLSDHENDA
jgi:hypothetical protein